MKHLTRRQTLKYGLKTGAATLLSKFGLGKVSAREKGELPNVNLFNINPQSAIQYAEDWESLNPGYWQFLGENGLRRAVSAIGDRARTANFPFHYESPLNPDGVMTTEYDPSLPMSTMWNRKWILEDNFSIALKVKVNQLTKKQRSDDNPDWKMYQSGYGLFGVALGGQSQFESFFPSESASPTFLIKENGEFGFMRYNRDEPEFISASLSGKIDSLKVGDEIDLIV